MEYLAAVGTYSVPGSEGLYSLAIGEGGDIRVLDKIRARDVGYLAASPDGNVVYATEESMVFRGQGCGGVSAYRISPSGELSFLNEQAVAGQMPCYVWRGEGELYAASFLSGCVSVHAIRQDGDVDKIKQIIQLDWRDGIAPSAHCVMLTPDQRYLCIVDVTGHRICFYRRQKGEWREASVCLLPEPFDYRPRQVAFGAGHAYIATETGHGLLTFRYQGEEPSQLLIPHQSFDLIPPDYQGKSRGSCVKLTPNQKMLICSVRYTDVMTIFRVGEDGELSDRICIPTQGKCPRDFDISPDGAFVLVGMQQSNSVALYRIDYEGQNLILVSEYKGIPSATSVRFVR